MPNPLRTDQEIARDCARNLAAVASTMAELLDEGQIVTADRLMTEQLSQHYRFLNEYLFKLKDVRLCVACNAINHHRPTCPGPSYLDLGEPPQPIVFVTRPLPSVRRGAA